MTRQQYFERRIARTKDITFTVIRYLLLGIWAVIVLFPFYWMLLTSVKEYGAYNSEFIPRFFTLSPTIKNYIDAFTTVSLGRYFINTVIYTLATTALMLAVTVPAAFAFARLEFKGKDIVFVLFLALMMIPTELVIITNFVTVTRSGSRGNNRQTQKKQIKI